MDPPADGIEAGTVESEVPTEVAEEAEKHSDAQRRCADQDEDQEQVLLELEPGGPAEEAEEDPAQEEERGPQPEW